MVASTQAELEAIRQDYITSLEELTFNSRPIITNLTIIAQENIQAAEVITRAIEEHISKCAPPCKLPALYLLDSICKNVGSPYTLLFGRNLYKTFTDAYTLVTDPVRRKMHELFQTWKQPAMTTGQHLFSNESIRRIENFLLKARTALLQSQQQEQQRRSASPYSSIAPVHYSNTQQRVPSAFSTNTSASTDAPKLAAYQSSPPTYGDSGIAQSSPHGFVESTTPPSVSIISANSSGPVTTQSLLTDISNLIQLTTNKIHENPSDQDLTTQLSLLSQIHNILLTSNLPPSQLQAIKDNLAVIHNEIQSQQSLTTLAGNKRKAESAPPMTSPAPKKAWTPSSIINESWSSSLPSQQLDQSQSQQFQSLFTSNTLSSLPPSLIASVAQMLSQPAPASTPLQSQFHNSLSGTHKSDPTSLFASLMSAGLISEPVKANEMDGAFKKLLSSNVTLTNKFVSVAHPELISLLYESMPLQCSSCGRRFADTEEDRKARDAHLDWHFRVNKRVREDTRGQSRCWFLTEEDWIQCKDLSEENSNGSENVALASVGESAALNGAKEDVSTKYIPTPKDPAIVAMPCPICKEKFKSVWHDKAEDWVWVNAVQAENGKIYHATCLQEVENST
ncbi:hypothetical protein V1511DRAFT_458175 [Dipodascopsis uninucleata]